MQVTVNVTQEHIENGQRGDCGLCPVALAFHDAGYPDVQVRCYGVRLKKGAECLPLPKAVTCWISNFDLLGEGEPFGFELEMSDAN